MGNLFSNTPVEAEKIEHQEVEDGGVFNHNTLFTFVDHSTGEKHPISPWMVMGIVAIVCFGIVTLSCLAFCWCRGCFKRAHKKASKGRMQDAEMGIFNVKNEVAKILAEDKMAKAMQELEDARSKEARARAAEVLAKEEDEKAAKAAREEAKKEEAKAAKAKIKAAEAAEVKAEMTQIEMMRAEKAAQAEEIKWLKAKAEEKKRERQFAAIMAEKAAEARKIQALVTNRHNEYCQKMEMRSMINQKKPKMATPPVCPKWENTYSNLSDMVTECSECLECEEAPGRPTAPKPQVTYPTAPSPQVTYPSLRVTEVDTSECEVPNDTSDSDIGHPVAARRTKRGNSRGRSKK